MDRNTVKLKSGYLRVGGIYTTCSYAVSFKPCKIIPHEWQKSRNLRVVKNVSAYLIPMRSVLLYKNAQLTNNVNNHFYSKEEMPFLTDYALQHY